MFSFVDCCLGISLISIVSVIGSSIVQVVGYENTVLLGTIGCMICLTGPAFQHATLPENSGSWSFDLTNSKFT